MQQLLSTQAPGSYDPARPEDIQAFIPKADEHFTLPAEVTKAVAINAAVAALLLKGGTARDVLVYRQIADRTERTAWHSARHAPVNWRRQCDMAREVGLSERQFRNIERRLERMGLIARTTADNGYRGRRAGQGYHEPVRCGLSLEPTIANYEAFTRLQAEADAEENRRLECVQNVRTAKQRVRQLIASIQDTETRAWAEEAYEEVKGVSPRDTLRGLDMEVLENIHAFLFDLEDRIREALTPLIADPQSETPTEAPCPSQHEDQVAEIEINRADEQAQDIYEPAPAENTSLQQDISGAPEMGSRCHIQPESNLNESCNDLLSNKSTPAYADDLNSSALRPHGHNNCLEKNDRRPSHWINPVILQKLTPQALRDLASEDAALYLEALEDWRECLPYLLRDLGINVSAWLDAVDLMGEEIAFIALLVIDRNRFHPVTPVHNPGGALRAFTSRARDGELNLTRAILGIWERDRQGKQPKAHSDGRAVQ